MQNAAGAVRVQPAAPAPYYQPAAGFRTYAAPAKANSVVIRAPAPVAAPAPPKRDGSTRMPVATVKAMEFIASAKQSSPYAPSLVPREDFKFHQAVATSAEWYGGGTFIGGSVGCAIGGLATFYAAGVGCVPGAAFGASVGAVPFAIVGFLAGGYDVSTKDVFGWGPDKMYTGR